MRPRIKKATGVLRPLGVGDPRNPEHPSQRANWLALMRELGRLMAAQEWERQHGGTEPNDGIETSGGIREVFKRPLR